MGIGVALRTRRHGGSLVLRGDGLVEADTRRRSTRWRRLRAKAAQARSGAHLRGALGQSWSSSSSRHGHEAERRRRGSCCCAIGFGHNAAPARRPQELAQRPGRGWRGWCGSRGGDDDRALHPRVRRALVRNVPGVDERDRRGFTRCDMPVSNWPPVAVAVCWSEPSFSRSRLASRDSHLGGWKPHELMSVALVSTILRVASAKRPTP